jgi:negative regulator of sigma E activity
MSDHQSKENLSAWIDGELDHARASALPNQILQSAEMRQSWSEWHLVGGPDAKRGRCASIHAYQTNCRADQIRARPSSFEKPEALT